MHEPLCNYISPPSLLYLRSHVSTYVSGTAVNPCQRRPRLSQGYHINLTQSCSVGIGNIFLKAASSPVDALRRSLVKRCCGRIHRTNLSNVPTLQTQVFRSKHKKGFTSLCLFKTQSQLRLRHLKRLTLPTETICLTYNSASVRGEIVSHLKR